MSTRAARRSKGPPSRSRPARRAWGAVFQAARRALHACTTVAAALRRRRRPWAASRVALTRSWQLSRGGVGSPPAPSTQSSVCSGDAVGSRGSWTDLASRGQHACVIRTLYPSGMGPCPTLTCASGRGLLRPSRVPADLLGRHPACRADAAHRPVQHKKPCGAPPLGLAKQTTPGVQHSQCRRDMPPPHRFSTLS